MLARNVPFVSHVADNQLLQTMPCIHHGLFGIITTR